ncbi:MAG TPA: ABC transporter ATP-binding protein [Longimicrobiales bacterium]
MLRLEGVSKRFGDVVAVKDVTLEVPRGELLSLLGPSGCGKTTTLRMIAGFEPVDGGRILLDGRDVTAVPPQKRQVGMVFQNYALFPHLDVRENVAFGLRAQGYAREEIPRRVERALELVDLQGYARRRIQELSGGQQQRIALARALAPEPPLLLLDEPLSNLDAALRERTREELRAVLRRIGITAVFVTHDQEEAFALSDRIALMNAGRIEQVGTPEALYQQPATPFAAGFVGHASFLPAVVVETGPDLLCQVAPGVRWSAVPAGAAPPVGAAVQVMARPETLTLGLAAAGGTGLAGTVLDRRFAGAAAFFRVDVALPGGRTELLVQAAPDAAAGGQTVEVRPAGALRAFPDPSPPAAEAGDVAAGETGR